MICSKVEFDSMPRQNRVNPFSELIAVSARGALTGNRGCLHDDQGQIRRLYASRRWIICVLDFKGRRRKIMTPGHYTELFFLDEATALAAGHRPCAECQRGRFNLFRHFWQKANPAAGGLGRMDANRLDNCLHRERLAKIYSPEKLPVVPHLEALFALPGGTFVADGERSPFLVWGNRLLRWSFTGYEPIEAGRIVFPLRVLTPPSVVLTLEAGYPLSVHPSVGAW